MIKSLELVVTGMAGEIKVVQRSRSEVIGAGFSADLGVLPILTVHQRNQIRMGVDPAETLHCIGHVNAVANTLKEILEKLGHHEVLITELT